MDTRSGYKTFRRSNKLPVSRSKWHGSQSVPPGLGILQTKVAAWLSLDKRREAGGGRRLFREDRIDDSSESRCDKAAEEFGELQYRDLNRRPPRRENEEAPTGAGDNK